MKRPRLSGVQLVAVTAFAFAAVVGFALSPVQQETHTYTYRPDSLQGANSVVAPLALARVTPDALAVTLPCEEPGSSFASMDVWVWRSSSPGAEHSSLQFAGLGDRLLLAAEGDSVFVEIGEREVMRIPISNTSECVAEMDYRDGTLRLVVADTEATVEVEAFRLAEANFAGSAATSSVSEVVVETRELGSSPSPLQLMLLGMAVLLLVVAGREIGLRGVELDRAGQGNRGLLGRVRSSVGAVDLVVLTMLVIWLFLIPTNIDDGFTGAIQRRYDAYGDFSGIFSNSIAAPIGYWINWIQHYWLQLSDSALWARLPALLLGMATWAGVRSIGRSVDIPGSAGSVWVMAAVYTVGFGAWGMTLRPEPVVAALVVASLALALRFRKGRRGWTVVAWALVIALGLTVHPTGLLVLAPVLVSSGDLWRWSRSSREAAYLAGASAMVLGSLFVVLLLVDSNLSSLFERLRAVRVSGLHSQSPIDELARYDFLDQTPYATVFGRLGVAFMLIGVFAFLTAKKVRGDARRLIGWSTVAGVALLALVPSKWPVHFAGLVGLAALLVALELRGSGPSQTARGRTGVLASGRTRSMLVLLGTVMFVAYAWSISRPWTVFDLRTVDWWSGLDLSAIGTWAAIGIAVIGLLLAHRRWRQPVGRTPSESVVLIASLAALVFTASTLVIDTVRTDGWTFGRQNVQSLFGREGCGLGDEIVVPVPGSLRALSLTQEHASTTADRIAADLGFGGGGEFVVGGFSPSSLNGVRPLEGMGDVGSWVELGDAPPDANMGSHRTAWHQIEPGQDTLALMVMGWLDEDSGNAIAVQWGTAVVTGVESVAVESVGAEGYFTDWSLRTLVVPTAANRVRVLLRDATTGAGNAWVASSLPLAVWTASIGEVVDSYHPEIMITPPLALYFPCVQVPVFAGAVVSPPGMMIQMWDSLWQRSFAAAALADRYYRVPLTLDPPPRDVRIGAHVGDADNFMFVSQEYLTGQSARAGGRFEREESDE